MVDFSNSLGHILFDEVLSPEHLIIEIGRKMTQRRPKHRFEQGGSVLGGRYCHENSNV